MEGVREYLLSVTAGAMLCGIVSSLIGQKGHFVGLYRMLCGLFLCMIVISPIVQVNISDFSRFAQDLLQEGQFAAQEGTDSYDQTLRQIITDETRAYIMDKARSYGAEVHVEIILSEENPPVPEACTISGSISPYVKQQLTKMLKTDLDIPEEKQTWIR